MSFEYPEVTVVQKALNTFVKNRTITQVEVKINKLIKNASEIEFKKFLINKKISYIENISKFLVFNFTDSSRLLSHLRMTGKYFIRNINDKNLYAYKHDYIYFYFDNQEVLVYNDQRIFGSFEIINSNDNRTIFEIKNLAKLPGFIDKKILYQRIHKKNISIKKILLDQSLILGIGNIYADESLFACKINPMKKAKDITYEEFSQLLDQAQKIMDHSIKLGGSTVQNYSSVNGISGKFQNNLMVYGRENQICKVCKIGKIKKVKLDYTSNGRGTTFCENCQKE
ncbi:bifunctional DNA-formamidopyrimidine glycosylase/DNA-(apurinic or apyrimidinic site) lyase [Mycoplasmopsis cynos]|uniref:bifunctional DNA-formamidopyrimidine glycosylase/DNA-(apurinic or apyrimidinic site) lyase n=1 Tax=Mycoplasmopsis cynos TaxID=171284 RepID=UPI0024C809BB|nr:bifunctional DNA-formamidopyrimidine glycosylase/DNA-(apurinic or apyrimidinic site) lyase [Mycoplasmopsis cynos]WAM08307.1 bifunctional DNA-formamidopyrimidine glycosylase/DNA-(apurinic or apyrimidinic site) lyase [Mycoplasmopsis cynos]